MLAGLGAAYAATARVRAIMVDVNCMLMVLGVVWVFGWKDLGFDGCDCCEGLMIEKLMRKEVEGR